MDFSFLEHMRKLNKLQHHLSEREMNMFWNLSSILMEFYYTNYFGKIICLLLSMDGQNEHKSMCIYMNGIYQQESVIRLSVIITLIFCVCDSYFIYNLIVINMRF